MLLNQSNYYPNPTNGANAIKKTIYDNGQPIYNYFDTPFEWQGVPYDDVQLIVAQLSQNYSFNKFQGYISVPIGTADFMGRTDVETQECYCPNALYDETGNNDWTNRVFVDIRNVSTFNLWYRDMTEHDIHGHVVIPIPKANKTTDLFSSMDAQGKIAFPTDFSGHSSIGQVTYIPKGQIY